jgi:4-hydroxybenzoate polyprenyltransferase
MSADAFASIHADAPTGRHMAHAWRLLRTCVRLDEVLVLQGTPLLGALLAIGSPTLDTVLMLAFFSVGSCCLVTHVFVLNDWAGMHADLRDPNRAWRVFAAQGVSRQTMGQLSVVSLLLTVLLLSPFGARTVAIALAIAGLSALYSLDRYPGKGVPVFGSLLHLTGGVLHFHLGYSLFGTFGDRSVALSTFFALTFAAGHLTQEARDYDADRSNGIWTNAVTFGRTWAFVTGLVLFTLAGALLVAMALHGVVPRALVLVAPVFFLHLCWSLQTLRAGLTFESIRRLRRRYRGLYGAIGVLILLATFAR